MAGKINNVEKLIEKVFLGFESLNVYILEYRNRLAKIDIEQLR